MSTYKLHHCIEILFLNTHRLLNMTYVSVKLYLLISREKYIRLIYSINLFSMMYIGNKIIYRHN